MSTTLQWFKSSYSSNEGGNCVEVSTTVPSAVHVRDSKNVPAAGPVLRIAPGAWDAFLGLTREDAGA